MDARKGAWVKGWLVSVAVVVSAIASATSVGPIPRPSPLGPWEFQMTPEQVTSASAYGPYKTFSNGDLETFAGDFAGTKANVQFYFTDGKLVRMTVSRYEGTDIKDAAGVFADTYRVLQAMYGPMETPDITIAPADQANAQDLVRVAAGAQVDVKGKTQMAPVKQPPNAFVFSSLQRQEVQGKTYYYVSVIFDPPRP